MRVCNAAALFCALSMLIPNAVIAQEQAPSAGGPANVSAADAATKTTNKPPFRVSKGFSRGLQKYTGLTWMTNEAISGIASTALSLKTHGLVHAKIRTYSFTDLLDGEFQSFDVTASGGKFSGVPVGNVHAWTDMPFKLRYFQRKGHKSGLRNPILVNVEGGMAQGDLSRALKSKNVENGLRFLKLDMPGLGEQHLQVLQPKIDLQGDHVILDSYLVTAGASRETGIPLHVVATPRLDQDRFIVLKDLQIESTAVQDSKDFSVFVDELLNPLVDFGRMDRFTHAFRLSNLQIGGERVKFGGRLLLAPKPADKSTFSAPFSINNPSITNTPPPAQSTTAQETSTAAQSAASSPASGSSAGR